MVTAVENEFLTQVGPGKPMGELLRRYWQPFATLSDIENKWTHKVRLLGEDLVLFKDRSGELGLIEEHCPHRRASLAHGIPERQGIRCSYHGWVFDRNGVCIEQPNGDPSSIVGKAVSRSYPIQELAGILFAYMGPLPAPLLPRFDAFVEQPAIRMLGRAVVPTNWLQIMENSLDPVHTEWLHGKFYEFLKEEQGTKVMISQHHLKIAFDEFEHGIIKRRLLEGQPQDAEDWVVGHPILFPNQLSVGNGSERNKFHAFQIRVPVDDTHTLHLWYTAFVPPPGRTFPGSLTDRLHTFDVPFLDGSGEHIVDFVDGQDVMAWMGQGPIADRTAERLQASDAGVVKYRRMLVREVERMQSGLDPKGVLRDPGKNECIELPAEKDRLYFQERFEDFVARTHLRYSPVSKELVELVGRR
jgi:5,5'-dehydrodivanillate O-demethylase oxygenase subunit